MGSSSGPAVRRPGPGRQWKFRTHERPTPTPRSTPTKPTGSPSKPASTSCRLATLGFATNLAGPSTKPPRLRRSRTRRTCAASGGSSGPLAPRFRPRERLPGQAPPDRRARQQRRLGRVPSFRQDRAGPVGEAHRRQSCRRPKHASRRAARHDCAQSRPHRQHRRRRGARRLVGRGGLRCVQGGLVAFSKTIAREHARHGITINVARRRDRRPRSTSRRTLRRSPHPCARRA